MWRQKGRASRRWLWTWVVSIALGMLLSGIIGHFSRWGFPYDPDWVMILILPAGLLTYGGTLGLIVWASRALLRRRSREWVSDLSRDMV